MSVSEVIETRRWDLDGGNRSLGVCPRRVYHVPGTFFLSLCLLDVMRREALLYQKLLTIMFCFNLDLKATEPADIMSQINTFLSGISQKMKS
jgi:hypothetical protein